MGLSLTGGVGRADVRWTLRPSLCLEGTMIGAVNDDAPVRDMLRRIAARAWLDVMPCSGSAAEARQLVQGGDHRNVGVDVRPTTADGAVLQPDRPHSNIA